MRVGKKGCESGGREGWRKRGGEWEREGGGVGRERGESGERWEEGERGVVGREL